MTRATTEGLPRLDVRALARAGALRPGAVSTITWSAGATVTIAVPVDRPDIVVLHYRSGTRTGPLVTVQEPVSLRTTQCTFGGVRIWVACPGCDRRCAVLYGLHGRFRCRQCHDLAHPSTRKMPTTAIRRDTKLHSRLGASCDRLFHVPEKPRGMYWRTYERAVVKLLKAHDVQADACRAFLGKRQALIARLDGA